MPFVDAASNQLYWGEDRVDVLLLRHKRGEIMRRSLSIAALALALAQGAPVLAQVQLDHSMAQKLTDLGIDTAAVVQEDDVGYINQILASEADDATKKAEIMKLLEEN